MKPFRLGALRRALAMTAIAVVLPAPGHARPALSSAHVAPILAESRWLDGVANSVGMTHDTDELVTSALGMIGIPYRWGGDTPEGGLDCSGFVRYVYNTTHGIDLPRRAAEMSRSGALVSERDLQPGDLVFFRTTRRAISHVGIYIGNDAFVHAPSTGQAIRVDNIHDKYWRKTFAGARRIDIDAV